MIDKRTGKDLKDIPILEEPMLRIYIMLNQEGKIKIGKTKNIYQRYQSLCGSNSQGIEITDVCCSPSTYLYTLETIMHNKFDKYRIPNTEWFYNKEDLSGEMLFKTACEELKLLFSSASYKRCNEIRKEFWESTHRKVGGANDN
jgi:hypothetical protein